MIYANMLTFTTGRGGAKIKELEESSGCKIQVKYLFLNHLNLVVFSDCELSCHKRWIVQKLIQRKREYLSCLCNTYLNFKQEHIAVVFDYL